MRSGLKCFSLLLFIAPSRVLPDIAGQSLAGKPIELHWAATKPTLAIVTFSRAAAADARAWRHRLGHDAEVKSAARVVGIIMLESVPRFMRGMVASGIKSAMPTEQYDSTMLVYHGEDRWKKLLNASDDRHAYVVLVDEGGHLRRVDSNGFSDVNYARVKRELGGQLQ